ncbi:unnamed protein product, partial [Polarella glacialis]
AKHVCIRCLSRDSPYWVCAYANRQHSLDDELSADPTETSFCKAMNVSEGLLLILDQQQEFTGPATPFSRVWCAFELWTTLSDTSRSSKMLLDVASQQPSGAVLLTDGLTEWDMKQVPRIHPPSWHKATREATFGLELIKQGLTTELQRAQATQEADRVHILNCITKRPLEAAPLDEHEDY